MRKIYTIFCVAFCNLFFINCRSGLVTMTNGCYKSIQSGQDANKAGNYSAALDQFNSVLQSCKAFDAKEQANAGKAEALNGLKQYNEALSAANDGLTIKKISVGNLFQKATAEFGLGNDADAKADLAQIIDLTQKNQNIKDRATIYGKMAELDLKQSMYNDAMNNMQSAISLDGSNPDFYILKGDIYSMQNDFSNAINAYNQAVQYAGGSQKSWSAKIEAEVKAYQRKYSSGTDAGVLAKKMSAEDKRSFCADISEAKSHGVKSQGIDLLQLTICK